MGTTDADWDHYELYYLVAPEGDADDTSSKYEHSSMYTQGDGSASFFVPSGLRISFAMYSVDAAGNKSVTKTSVFAID